jgi:hypothetical protein
MLIKGGELGEITNIMVLIAIIVFGRIQIRILIRIAFGYVRLIASIGVEAGVDTQSEDEWLSDGGVDASSWALLS